MTMATNVSMDERVEGFRRFYRRENERPLLGFFIESEYPLHRYRASRALPESRPLTPDDFDVAPYLDDGDRLFARHEECGGDFIWSASAFWGIPWIEAALGCELWANHKTGAIRVERSRGFAGPDSVPSFDADSPWMRKMAEFLDATAERSAGRYPLATTRMRGVSDLLSALYGGENSLVAMMTEPDEVGAVCARLTELWIAMARMQLDHIPAFHGGVGSFYYGMWAPPDTVWHQEDAAAMLSPDLFERFISPCAARIASAFGACVMHMHPTGYMPYRQYLEMDFTALELHIDEGGPRARDLCDIHLEILERKPLLIWGALRADDLDRIFSKLPAAGLAVNVAVDSPEAARAIYGKYFGKSEDG